MTRSEKIAAAGVLLELRRRRRMRPRGPLHGFKIAAAGGLGAGALELVSLALHAVGIS